MKVLFSSPKRVDIQNIESSAFKSIMSPPTSRLAYGVLFVALLSLVPAAHAQSACGLQGFSSCTSEGRTTGYGCCPTGWECYASECSYTGTPTLPATTATTTTCPGMPAHYLCPASLGGRKPPLPRPKTRL